MKDSKFNEFQPSSFEKRILSLDKYIDPKFQRKAIHIAIVLGIAISLLLAWVTITGAVSNSTSNITKIGAFIFLYALMEVSSSSDMTDRHLPPQLRKKHKYGCGCSRVFLPMLGQKQWLKARFKEYYTCIIYPFTAWFLLGFSMCNLTIYLWNKFF